MASRPSTSSSNGLRGPPLQLPQLGSPLELAPRSIPSSLSSASVPNGGTTPFTSSQAFPSQPSSSLAAPVSLHHPGHPPQQGPTGTMSHETGGSVPASAYLPPHPTQPTPRKGRSRPKKGSRPPKLTFVQALYKLLANPDVYFCARWDDQRGQHILIQDAEKLMTFVRKDPNFKMTMMPSFTRQLNIYGFLKRFTCAEAFPDYEPLDAKVLAIWTHEYLHKNSSAADIANVKRRVVEPSRTDVEESPEALYSVPQAYPLVYSQPLQPRIETQPRPSAHRHGLSFEYEDAQQPIATPDAWTPASAPAHEQQRYHQLQQAPMHSHSMQELRQPYYAASQYPPRPASRHLSSDAYHLPPPPPADQPVYDSSLAGYETGPSFHNLRHQASFTSESSATSSVYEMEGSSHSEVEMGYRTPPRTFESSIREPIPVRLEYPLHEETQWATTEHISPPVPLPSYGASSMTPVPGPVAGGSAHQHPFRYSAWRPKSTYAPPSPPSLEDSFGDQHQEGLVYLDETTGMTSTYVAMDSSAYGSSQGSQGSAMGGGT